MMTNINQYLLLLFQIIAHIALTAAIFTFSLQDWLLSIFIYFLTGCLGVSITYHRLLSHRSWNAPSWWVYVGSLLGTWGLVGSPLAWSNNHIAHHRYVDTEKDPHSPKHLGWWKVQWFSMLYSCNNFKFSVKNLSAFQIFIHRYYFLIHFFILIFLILYAGLHLTMILYLVPAAILWNMGSLVNTLNHSDYGYKNFNNKNSSTNNVITGILTWGEGWHNNHHASPGSSNFGVLAKEFDISYHIIKILEIRS